MRLFTTKKNNTHVFLFFFVFSTALSDALLSLDLFSEWIVQACTFWEEHQDVQPSVPVATFVLELTRIVAKNETRFLHLSNSNAYQRLYDIFHLKKSDCPPAISVAYVKLLRTFLRHR